MGTLTWFGIATTERKRLYDDAVRQGARRRGILLGLALPLRSGPGWTPLLVGALTSSIAAAAPSTSPGGSIAAPPFAMSAMPSGRSPSPTRSSAARGWAAPGSPWPWSLGPGIIHYGGVSVARWAYLWDVNQQWGYCYFVGPIAAILFISAR